MVGAGWNCRWRKRRGHYFRNSPAQGWAAATPVFSARMLTDGGVLKAFLADFYSFPAAAREAAAHSQNLQRILVWNTARTGCG